MELNKPEIVAEVTKQFEEYEDALMSNDVDLLVAKFWDSEMVLRYGTHENLYGIEEIENFRKGRDVSDVRRTLSNTQIFTFGDDYAVANTEFERTGSGNKGRQSQTWVRFPDQGWRIVAAHVSFMAK